MWKETVAATFIAGFCLVAWEKLREISFWDIAPCSIVEVYQRLRSAYCLHHQGIHRPDDEGSKHL
jgi:hypothetical protein